MTAAGAPAPDDAGVVDLPPDLYAEVLPELQRRLLGLIDAGEAITVRSRAVERIDAAAVQLLVAFAFAAADAGVGLRFTSPSPVFARTMRRLGLDPLFA